MAGLNKTAKGIGDRAEGYWKKPGQLFDPVKMTKASLEDPINDVTGAFTPDVPAPEDIPIIPIPDQNKLALEAKRRRAKMVGTGRSSTILTEGLGG